MENVPDWLRTFVYGSVILNINSALHFFIGNEVRRYTLRSTSALSALSRFLDIYVPVTFAQAVDHCITIIEKMLWATAIDVATFTQERLRYIIDPETRVFRFILNVATGYESTP